MRIGAAGFQPYIYNTNYLNPGSLGRVSAIGDDLLKSKTDYSELLDESLNENPLRKGETSNFEDIFQMQFQKGRMNASRLFKPAGEEEDRQEDFDFAEELTRQADVMQDRNLYLMQKAAQAYSVNMIA